MSPNSCPMLYKIVYIIEWTVYTITHTQTQTHTQTHTHTDLYMYMYNDSTLGTVQQIVEI